MDEAFLIWNLIISVLRLYPGKGGAMPIDRLVKAGKVKPEDSERLSRALALALSYLGLVDRQDPICEIVAQKIVEIDRAGTRDPDEIAKLTVKQLGP
jgi:hypothetical protein